MSSLHPSFEQSQGQQSSGQHSSVQQTSSLQQQQSIPHQSFSQQTSGQQPSIHSAGSSTLNFTQRASEILKIVSEKDSKFSQRMSKCYGNQIKNNSVENVENKDETHGFSVDVLNAERLGSLLNEVYRVQLKNNSLLFVKHHSDTLKEFISRDLEFLLINQMSQKKEYPQIFYRDDYVRVEEFIKGGMVERQNLNPMLLKAIIQKLAYFSKNYSYLLQGYTGCKNRQISYMLTTFRSIYQSKRQQAPDLMKQVAHQIEQILQTPAIMQNLEKILYSQRVVLNHNDSNLSSLLVLSSLQNKLSTETNTTSTENIQVQLFDYQFANLNYIGYDLGNFFNQIVSDYSHAFDSGVLGEKGKFDLKKEWQLPQNQIQELITTYYTILQQNWQVKTDMQQRLRDVRIGRMLSHLFWLFVGVRQVDDPNVNLCMISYIKKRHEAFMRLYKQIIGDQSHTSENLAHQSQNI